MQGDAQAQLTALRDEGNKFFGKKEYTKAFECYDKALKSIQAGHPDKPLLHSNKAACHMMGKRYILPTVTCGSSAVFPTLLYECDSSFAATELEYCTFT